MISPPVTKFTTVY